MSTDLTYAWGTPPWEDKPQFECSQCGKPLKKDIGICSSTCFNASLL
jgi:hypothetical protein|tara:strand:- start:310 stop:450 length:141 start_codon:yes stop_codon:yes gene_type:complete